MNKTGITLLLSAALIVTATASSLADSKTVDELYSDGTITGALPMEGNLVEPASGSGQRLLLSRGAQPDSYDPREEDWFKSYISTIGVKNQGNTGLCWAFSTATAMELSYLKETGKLPTKLSAGHMAYFYYHRATDPLGLTKGDENILPAGASWVNRGGVTANLQLALSTWSGAASEAKAPTRTNGSNYSYDASLAYDDVLKLENSTILSLSSPSDVKAAIRKHGAVQTTYYNDNKNLSDRKNYYNSSVATSNHAVTIIGWDDNYSRDNFKSGTGATPKSDGAWIMLNSWGTASGDNGFLYISYDDISLGIMDTSGKQYAIAYDAMAPSAYTYNYQYDGTANILNPYPLKTGGRCANIFKVKTSSSGTKQALDAIAFNDKTAGSHSYKVTIYTGIGSGAKPDTGTKARSLTVTTDGPGFHTFSIKNSDGKGVDLKDGSYYSIVLEALDDTTIGYDRTDAYSKAVTAAGQSFYQSPGSGWYDLNQQNRSVRIKGFTNEYISHTHKYTKKRDKEEYLKTAPTCTKKGYYYYSCTKCDKKGSKTYSVKALGHSYEVKVDTPATTSKTGYYHKECKRCSKKLSKEKIYKASKISLKSKSTAYKGSNKEKVTVYVKTSKKKTISTSYYTVAYDNDYVLGKGTATVTLKGRYTGSKTLTYSITKIPAAVRAAG